MRGKMQKEVCYWSFVAVSLIVTGCVQSAPTKVTPRADQSRFYYSVLYEDNTDRPCSSVLPKFNNELDENIRSKVDSTCSETVNVGDPSDSMSRLCTLLRETFPRICEKIVKSRPSVISNAPRNGTSVSQIKKEKYEDVDLETFCADFDQTLANLTENSPSDTLRLPWNAPDNSKNYKVCRSLCELQDEKMSFGSKKNINLVCFLLKEGYDQYVRADGKEAKDSSFETKDQQQTSEASFTLKNPNPVVTNKVSPQDSPDQLGTTDKAELESEKLKKSQPLLTGKTVKAEDETESATKLQSSNLQSEAESPALGAAPVPVSSDENQVEPQGKRPRLREGVKPAIESKSPAALDETSQPEKVGNDDGLSNDAGTETESAKKEEATSKRIQTVASETTNGLRKFKISDKKGASSSTTTTTTVASVDAANDVNDVPAPPNASEKNKTSTALPDRKVNKDLDKVEENKPEDDKVEVEGTKVEDDVKPFNQDRKNAITSQKKYNTEDEALDSGEVDDYNNPEDSNDNVIGVGRESNRKAKTGDDPGRFGSPSLDQDFSPLENRNNRFDNGLPFDSRGTTINVSLNESEESGFFSYFMFSAILVGVLYLIVHNKKKLIAYVVEGRRPRSRSRRASANSQYRRLENTFD